MSRIVRVALAAAAGLAAIAGGAPAAHAEQNTTYYRFQAEHSGKCLTVAGGSLANGAVAVQSTCASGLDNQLFALKPAGKGQLQVQAKHSGRCLTVMPDKGWTVQQAWCGDATSQNWRVMLVDIPKGVYELRPNDALDYCLTVPESSTADGVQPFIGQCMPFSPQRWRMTPATS
ncbi:RICIN domain-containing protein [Streptomyces sp. NPDC051907]|uniref:RICIN domain-containing protein n=1 Tax=Streptomyces sp. NPDC051907 TaxID=3155284 RepID=UPI00341D7FD3